MNYWDKLLEDLEQEVSASVKHATLKSKEGLMDLMYDVASPESTYGRTSLPDKKFLDKDDHMDYGKIIPHLKKWFALKKKIDRSHQFLGNHDKIENL